MKESQLSQNMPDTTVTPDKQSFPKVSAKEDYSYTKLFPFFNVEGEEVDNPETKQRLEFIYDYFKGESNDTADILWKINEIEHKIGAPEFGTRRYEKLYRYLKILDNRKVIDKELAAYENTVEKQ